MADYYPLIARAVSGLDKNTGENRRALYDRARAALVSQLRGVEPPLEETDITRERLGLEEAIRKVEAEASKRPRPDISEAEDAEPSLRDRGLRDFRETVAEAEGLGIATAEAKRAAHVTSEAMPPEPAPHYFEPPPAAEVPPVEEPAPIEEPPHIGVSLPPSPPVTYEQTYEQEEQYMQRPPRSYAGIIKLFFLLLVLAGIVGAAYWQRHAITSMVASFRSQPAPKPPESSQPAARPKISDRIGQRWRRKSCSTTRIRTIRRANATSVPQFGALRPCRRGRDSRPNSPSAPTSRYPNASCG
jgi:hypothetical protein